MVHKTQSAISAENLRKSKALNWENELLIVGLWTPAKGTGRKYGEVLIPPSSSYIFHSGVALLHFLHLARVEEGGKSKIVLTTVWRGASTSSVSPWTAAQSQWILAPDFLASSSCCYLLRGYHPGPQKSFQEKWFEPHEHTLRGLWRMLMEQTLNRGVSHERPKALLWFKAEKLKLKLVHTSWSADDFQVLY